ncbi:MAG: urease accessory protein UreH domain-containing protein [Candidatus Aminicenantales bacterium]
MIDRDIWMLAGTAATLGLVHTVIGPDHYLPFIVIGRARNWTLRKTLFVSFLAGLGHILSSVVLGFVGIALGIAVAKLEGVESARGGIAAWLLIGFGFAYFVWGMRWAWRGKPHVHAHLHDHEDAQVHPHGPDEGPHDPDHEHVHQHAHTHTHELAEHAHPHGEVPKKANITPWVLFTIFVFGPCEPLIPLVMYPAARHSTAGVVLVAAAFGLVTIATMLVIIAAASLGVSFVRLGKLERYSHALAGLVIFISGLAVQFLGL